MRKKILIIALGLFAIAIGIIVYKSAIVIMNNNRTTKTDESSVADKIKEEQDRDDNSGVFMEYFDHLINKDYYNSRFKNTYKQYFNDYFTDKFLHKYKNAVDIYPDIDDVFEIGRADFGEKDDEAILEIWWMNRPNRTRIVYKLMLTDDGKIDDCEIVETYDVDPRTFQRLDRPMTMSEEDAQNFISVLVRPNYYQFHYNPEESGIEFYLTYVNIPKSDDCQIINQPKEPYKCDNHFPYLKAMYCNPNMEIIDTKYYKVDYSTNDKAQFTKIEFIEATEEEFNNTPPLGYGLN